MSKAKKLTRAEKQQINAAIQNARRQDKRHKSAQDSIPFQRMFPDGICRVTDHYYTKTVQFQDINYQLNQNEDKAAIFDGWCDFLNYFDSSVRFELSFIDDFRHIRTAHQLRQQIQLLFLIAPDAVLPAFRNDGELFAAPSGIRLVIHLGGGQLRQMAEAPGNEIISSFAITVPALVSAKNGRNGFGHRGLFGNHKLHIVILPFSDWCRCCLHHYASSVSSG